MPNVVSHPCQLDESISNFMVLFSNFDKTNCKQTVKTMIRRRRTRRLTLVCTVCICPIKRTQGVYGLRVAQFAMYLINRQIQFVNIFLVR